MPKIIKLTENDIRNIAKRVVLEQGFPPYPSPDNSGLKDRTKPNPIAIAKINVKKNLHEALAAMEKLMKMSGVNPQTNNIVGDIEKVIQKFDDLYGEPQENAEEEV